MPAQPFGLVENPFAPGHDRRFVCPTRKRDDALDLLRKGIAERAPLLMVTGDPGIGKTSAVWDALSTPSLMASVAVVTHGALAGTGLIEAACHAFGIAAAPQGERVALLEQHLCELRVRGRRAVLVLEDAHGIEPAHIEAIQTLSEMKAEDRELLQIVLVGHPALEGRLARSATRLLERVSGQVRILPLSSDETQRYLHHRVMVARGNGGAIFPSDTCREIHSYTYGYPRDINSLAGRSLERAVRENSHHVMPDHVRSAVAVARLRGETTAPRPAADVPDFAPAPPEPAAEAARPAPLPVRRELPGPAATHAPSPQAHAAVAPPVPPVPVSAPSSDMLRWGQGIETPAMAREAYPSRRSFFREPKTGYAPPLRPRAESALQVTLAAVVVVGLLVTVLLVMRGWEKTPPTSGAPAPVAVSPPEGTKLPATNAVGGDASNPSRSGAEPPRASNPPPARPATVPAAPVQPVAVAPPPAAPAAVDSASERGPAAFALEVASYIDAERASAEAERIAGLTGQACRVVNDPEADSYAVVLGAFGTRRAAVRAADALLERDLVRQARVVAVGPEPTVAPEPATP